MPPPAPTSTTSTSPQLPESVDGCEDCLATGGLWLHLRICLECGHVGCCDDSPNRHATRARARDAATRSSARSSRARTGRWCFVDEVAMRIPDVHGHDAHPALAAPRVSSGGC